MKIQKPTIEQFAYCLACAVTIVATATLMALLAIRVLAPLTGHRVLRTTGNSMLPTMRPDALIVCRTDTENVSCGDIVIYADTNNELICHRLVREEDDGSLVTRGDNNDADDSPIGHDDLRGVVTLALPNLGGTLDIDGLSITLCAALGVSCAITSRRSAFE